MNISISNAIHMIRPRYQLKTACRHSPIKGKRFRSASVAPTHSLSRMATIAIVKHIILIYMIDFGDGQNKALGNNRAARYAKNSPLRSSSTQLPARKRCQPKDKSNRPHCYFHHLRCLFDQCLFTVGESVQCTERVVVVVVAVHRTALVESNESGSSKRTAQINQRKYFAGTCIHHYAHRQTDKADASMCSRKTTCHS